MPEVPLTLGSLAPLVGGEVPGDPDHPVTGVTGLDEVLPGAITFAESRRAVAEAEATEAGALLASPGTESRLPVIWVKNPRVAFAILLDHLHPRRRRPAGLHPGASVHPSARVHPTAHVGPLAVVEEGAEVGAGCELHARSVVGRNARLGPGCRLLPGASLGEGSLLGKDCVIGPLTSLGAGAEVGNDVEMGARCRLERCVVGSGCRIDNLVRVQEGVSLGEHVILVSHSVVGSGARMDRYSILAGEAMILPGRRVGEAAQLGGRSRVIEDIPPGQAGYAGNPAVPLREHLRQEVTRSKAPVLYRRLAGRP